MATLPDHTKRQLVAPLDLGVAGIGVIALIAGVWKLLSADASACTTNCEADYAPVIYFALALVAFGWPSIKSFKFKDYEFTRAIEEAREEVKQEAVNVLNEMKSAEHDVTGPTDATGVAEIRSTRRKRERIKVNLPAPEVDDDPQKGRFGRKSVREDKGRKLDAKVDQSGSFFTVDVLVETLPGAAKPLDGQVDFYVHDTFPREVYSVIAKDGKATYDFYASGAFTIGAVCDDGLTLLELDLSRLRDAPKRFRES